MRKDEFNELKIVNEDENLNFEFGKTQDSESTSYIDNDDSLRDEINDNPTTNGQKSLNKNKKKERKDKTKSEKDNSSSGSSGGGASASVGTTIATVAGASMVVVTTLSTLMGVNLFFNAKCKMNRIESATNSIVYELDLTDINNDECVITLENQDYSESQGLIEGINTGEFVDLIPSSEYHVSVVDVSYNNFVLYEDNISTKDEDVPPLESCIITFDANGGDGEQKEDVGYVGQEYILPECTFTAPNGYAFDCWQLSGTEDKYNPGEGYLVESQDAITFIALWGEAATLEFYPGIGAQGNVTSIKYVIGKEYTIPNGEEFFTAPENKEFDYWFDDMYSEQRHAGDVITIEDTYYSFTAHWKYLDGLTFTVTFETNGGSEIEPQVVQAGTNATKPDDPIKDDYIFKGWYSNSELTSTYNFLTPVTSDITIYAKWEVAVHTVTFITNGGPEITPQEVNDGECAIKPTDPVRGSYAFVGKDINTDSSQYYGYETDAGFSLDKYGTNYLCNKTAIPGEIVSVSLYTFSCQKISITYNVGFATTQLSGRSTAGGGSYELAGGSDYTFDNSVEGATYFSISCNEFDNGGDYSTVACIDKIVVVYNLETGGTSTVTFDTFNDLPPGYTDSDPITFYSVTGSYNFAGWYIDVELTEEYDFNTPVTKDIILYAKWTATYSVSGAAFNGFPHSTVSYATEADVGGITLEASAYSCYYNDAGDGHGLWIPLGSDSQSPEDSFSSYVANKTPINGSIKSIAITVGPSAYGGSSSNATLHVTFGKEPLLEHLVSGTTITYESDATIIVDCSMDGFSYFNITNVTENGLVIESIVITYTVN